MFRLIVVILIFQYALLYYQRLTQPVREDGPWQHLSKKVPTMGGVLVIGLSFLYAVCLGHQTHPLMLALLSFGALGASDDMAKLYYHHSRGLAARYKFILQWGLSALLLSQVPLDSTLNGLGFNLDLGWFYPIFASFIMVSYSNAFNLTDGVDGLAATQAIIYLVFLGAVSLKLGKVDITMMIEVLTLTVFGFLSVNKHPAKLFMGDVGSLAIGAFLGLASVMLKVEIIFALVTLVLVFETLSVILQVGYFKRTKRRLFKMAPFHHHLELSGWTENQVVMCFAGISLLLAIGGFYAI